MVLRTREMRNKKIIKIYITYLLVLLCFMMPTTYAEKDIIFTNEELTFISKYPVITIGVDPEFMPFEYVDSNGNYTGLAEDYIKRVEEISGLKFQHINGVNWQEAYLGAVEKNIDVLPCISKSADREKFFLFSDAYYNFQRVIVVKVGSVIKKQEDLENLTIAVQANSSHYGFLKEAGYKDIRTFQTVEKALSAVSTGEVSAFIGNLATTRYVANATGIPSLEYISYTSNQTNGLHFAIRNDWPILQSIINKSLQQITTDERVAIQNKWIGVEEKTDYTSLIRIGLGASVILLCGFAISFYWIIKLRNEVEKRKQIEKDLMLATREANEANRIKSDFLARMSHEIRTPLNGIKGMTFLLEHTDINHKQRAHLERIKQASNTMLNIINDILDFSKVEAGKIDIEYLPFRLDDAIKNVLNIIAYKIEEKELDFTLVREPNLPNAFVGDAKRLEQVLINILNNGIKFTDTGGITLSLYLVDTSRDKSTVEISIKDTGIGVAEENIPKLFEAFSQEDSSITRRFGGTGLGLSISQNIVKMMGGQIYVESEVGVGTEFCIRLSFDIDHEESSRKKEETELFQGLKAIILDKAGTQLNLMHSYLLAFGIQAEMTTSNEQLLHLLETTEEVTGKPYDLIIIDYETPEGGADILHHIIDENVKISNHPKVMLLLPFLRDDLMEDIDDHHVAISKPVFPSTLHDALIQLFDPTEAVDDLIKMNKKDMIEMPKDSAYHVLIVEDNKTNQYIAQSLLQSVGIKVSLASDGAEGISAFENEKQSLDLILMDLHMPNVDGYEATQIIRSKDSQIQIVALTADAISGIEEKCKAYGFSAFISKPFEPEQFISKVVELIELNQTDDNEIKLKIIHEEIWDKGLGLKMLGGSEQLFNEVLNIYLIENQNILSELTECYDSKKYDEAAKLVHKLKSSTGTIGATKVQQIASDLQSAFESKDEGHMKALYPHFQEMFLTLLDQIRNR